MRFKRIWKTYAENVSIEYFKYEYFMNSFIDLMDFVMEKWCLVYLSLEFSELVFGVILLRKWWYLTAEWKFYIKMIMAFYNFNKLLQNAEIFNVPWIDIWISKWESTYLTTYISNNNWNLTF